MHLEDQHFCIDQQQIRVDWKIVFLSFMEFSQLIRKSKSIKMPFEGQILWKVEKTTGGSSIAYYEIKCMKTVNSGTSTFFNCALVGKVRKVLTLNIHALIG